MNWTSTISKNAENDEVTRLYRSLKRIRRIEERIEEIYHTDKIKSPVHLSIGQEAISVGICDILNADDFVVGTYRGHALYLAKGGNLESFMAELFGKVDGCARGKGGSMHMIDVSANVLGCSAVVATNIPIAMGYAWKLKQQGKGDVIACFFGDGATEEGVFYESLNFAALHKLPMLFVCENNGLAIHAPLEKRWAHFDICARVSGFGIPVHELTEMDIFKIRSTANEVVRRIRAGAGPEFMECHTYRWSQDVGPGEDFDSGYRSRKELEKWQEKDQVARLAGILDSDLRARIDSDIEREIKDCITFAENSPFPRNDDLMTHVYAE
jgi:TPP-dependent pyruvate/acetoin dehydrogenase alpha subunit